MMKILCAIGTRGGPDLMRRLYEAVGSGHEVRILHVIDSGPRDTLEKYLHEPRLLRHPPPPPPHGPGPFLGASSRAASANAEPLDEAETAAGEAALEEARQEGTRLGLVAQIDIKKGEPEKIIVAEARASSVALIAILASEGSFGRPKIGPESVGHTARFVLDHAPCDVLLVRGRLGETIRGGREL